MIMDALLAKLTAAESALEASKAARDPPEDYEKRVAKAEADVKELEYKIEKAKVDALLAENPPATGVRLEQAITDKDRAYKAWEDAKTIYDRLTKTASDNATAAAANATVDAAELLETSLPEYIVVATSVESTSKKTEVKIPHVVERWVDFDPSALLANARGVRVFKREETLDADKYILDLETKVGERMAPIIGYLLRVLYAVTNDARFLQVVRRGTPSDTKGGICDDCVTLFEEGFEHVVCLSELKRPSVAMRIKDVPQDAHHPADVYNLREEHVPKDNLLRYRNLKNAVDQGFSYMFTKDAKSRVGGAKKNDPTTLGVKRAYVCNYNEFVFVQRVLRNNQEVLQLSPYYTRENGARLALAYFLLLAVQDEDKAVTRSTLKLPVRVIEPRTQSAQPPGQPPIKKSSKKSSLYSNLNNMVSGFTTKTTTEALGVDCLLTLPNAEVLAQSSKSTTFRGTVGGRDLVWRQIDVVGLPKHTEFSAETLEDMITSELAAYDRLRPVWRNVVPEALGFFQDFNSLWVMVTTYEGVSLAELVKAQGGLTADVKAKAVESLRALHARGVVHGDAKLRNVVFREADGKVLWVDLEFASLRPDGDADEWEREAEADLQELEDALADVPEVDGAPSPQSTPSRESPKGATPPPRPAKRQVLCGRSKVLPCC